MCQFKSGIILKTRCVVVPLPEITRTEIEK